MKNQMSAIALLDGDRAHLAFGEQLRLRQVFDEQSIYISHGKPYRYTRNAI
ncbi:hypothetical protein [Dendronalium sp. ChiSLP03b]|uniref:hypothetical protein n=1 Tax=Dendronalium sp. ChiSLP03b TaxID=3075381 RepID=UPI002AD3ADBE|nr:hypothetical protein [Dendronalium sp. ChiSLP03b]MDZ8209393.1 hypothetical protein [Dendronalium sp. ChiSLP03b]